MNKFLKTLALLTPSILLVGCQTTSSSSSNNVSVSYGSSASALRTTGFDANDYDQLADILYQDIVSSSKVSGNRVIALGPVAVDGALGSGFDARTFQESLRAKIHRGGLYQFSMAIDAGTTTLAKSTAAEREFRTKVLEFTHFQENIDNAEDDALYGGLAVVDTVISARLSASTRTDENTFERAYRLNYRIFDVRSGQLLWNAEVPFVKTKTSR